MPSNYYTYRICIANYDRVQVEQVDPDHLDRNARPDGAFRYQEQLPEIQRLTEIARNNTIHSEQSRELGEALFNALFGDALRQNFIDFYEAARQQEKPLRIELDIDERTLPEIAALPWEFMCVPQAANQGTLWLGTVPDVAFSRRRSQWQSAQPIQLSVNEKLRIALIVSAPDSETSGAETLGQVVYKPVQQILEELAKSHSAQIELLPVIDRATPKAIDRALKQKPHLVHFIGHGRLQNEAGQDIGQIALVDDLNQAFWVNADRFGELFNRHRPGVVLLQACEGGMLSDSRAFVGVASRVVQQNIPVVVAMQYEVTNSTACRFARSFYEELASGEPVDIAAQLGRRAISLAATDYQKRDFATPVIFMRVQDGHLFQYSTAAKNSSVDETPIKPTKQFLPHADPELSAVIPVPKPGVCADWGDAPEVPLLFGREGELNSLRQWILKDKCRVVAIVGLAGTGKSNVAASLHKGGQAARGLTQGGIGKTDLSAKLAKDIKSKFKYIYWQKLLNPPKPSEYFSKLVSFLSEGWETELPSELNEQIQLILIYLKKHRCLLILDNFEGVIRTGEKSGQYLDEFKGYGQFLEQLSNTSHQSCLLLTSREQPKELQGIAGAKKPVRFFELTGVNYQAAQEIFKTVDSIFARPELSGSEAEWRELTDFLRGNALALELAAQHIKMAFSGKIAAFLGQDTKVFEEIRQKLLDWHFEHLSVREQEFMYWFAINREPISLEKLQNDIISPENRSEVSSTLSSMQRNLPIETTETGLTLQPVLIEDSTRRLIEQIVEEIGTENIELEKINLFNNFSLLQAMATEYTRDTQVRLLVQPVLDRLISRFKGKEKLRIRLTDLLAIWQREYPLSGGYLGGNILNLFRQMEVNLQGYDLSNLTIRQAYFDDVTLHNVNFTNADLTRSAFADHFGSIFSVAFNHQRKLLAGCGDDGLIRLWHEQDWEPYNLFEGHTDFIRTLAFNSEGDLLASAGDDRTIWLWDVDTGKCIRQQVKAHTQWIQLLNFSPDGLLLASCGGDGLVKLWDVATFECVEVLEGHQAGVMAARFSPNGKILASGGRDGVIKLWNVETGRCIKTLTDHQGWIYSVHFSPDGQSLASGSRDRTVKLWDLNTYGCINTLKQHRDQVWSVAFSPDGKTLASAGDDGDAILWDVQSAKVRHVLKGHQSAIGRISFNVNGSVLATCSSDCKVRLWDVQSGKCVKVLYGQSNAVWTLAYSPDGNTLASNGKNFTITLWNMQTKQPIDHFNGHIGVVLAVAFSPDGHLLATGSEDHTVKLWDLQTHECKTLEGHDCRLETVTFSPDSKILATAGHDYRINLWDVSRKGWKIKKNEPAKSLTENDRVFSVKFNSTGTLLASGGADSIPKLWDVNTGRRLEEFKGHTDQVWTVAFSPNDKILASGSDDCTIKLWHIETGDCLNTLEGHDDWVWSVAFHPSGTILASASGDYTVKVWHVNSGKCLATLEGHKSWVWRVAFSPDGTTLASGSSDETVKLWDIRDLEGIQKDRCLNTLKIPGPYEGMKITGAKGLTAAEKAALKALGAVENRQ